MGFTIMYFISLWLRKFLKIRERNIQQKLVGLKMLAVIFRIEETITPRGEPFAMCSEDGNTTVYSSLFSLYSVSLSMSSRKKKERVK